MNGKPERFTEAEHDSSAGGQPSESVPSAEGRGPGQVEGDAEHLAEQLTEAQNRVLRAQAELENFRRRMRREMDEERRFAPQALLVDLLPVVDNIQRALAAAEKSPDGAGLLEGFKMVAQQLQGVFEKHNCREIPAAGEPFDPQLHEALSQIPSNEYPPHTVMYVHQPGYQLHDRVIRPAQVVVSAAEPDTAAGSE